MKKKLFVALFVLLLLFAFAGCTNFNTKLEDAVSEIHEKVLFGKSDDFEVTITVGKIEKDFALDGQKTELNDFVSFRVVQLKNVKYEELGMSFRINDKSEDFDLLPSPKPDVWSLTLDGTLAEESLEVVVFHGTDDFIVSTEKVNMGNFNPLDKLKEKFKDELMAAYRGGKFDCEITMRFVKNRHDPDSKFFWYVVVHTGQDEFFGLMIDAETGDIMSQKR